MSLVFEDDFDTLDTTVWRQMHPWYTPDPSRYSVTDSVLTMTINSTDSPTHTELVSLGPRDTGGPPYHPDALRWQEGFFEARIRYTDDPGAYPAFWMLSYEHANNAGPGEQFSTTICPTLRAEWDIMENGLNSTDPDVWSWMNVHRNNQPDLCSQPQEAKSTIRPVGSGVKLSDWHVWGGLWKDGLVTQYLDGVPVQANTTYDSFDQTMYLILFVSRHAGAVADEHTFEVDWVRVWQ